MAQHLVSLDTCEKLQRFLKDRAKHKRPPSVEDILMGIRPSVNRMLKRGFDYQDIVSALSEHNVSVDVAIIETFYAPTKRKSKSKPRRKILELQQPVSRDQLETVVARFAELAKGRKGLTLQELVAALSDAIAEDLEAGWRYEDIADWIQADFGIEIAPGTLKRYHSAVKSGKGQPHTTSPLLPSPHEQKLITGEAAAVSRPRRLKESSSRDLAAEFNL